jgi:hypothetical protein
MVSGHIGPRSIPGGKLQPCSPGQLGATAMANPKRRLFRTYNEACIEALGLFGIKLEQAGCVVRVWPRHTDPSGRPTQEMTALALQACALLDGRRAIEQCSAASFSRRPPPDVTPASAPSA